VRRAAALPIAFLALASTAPGCARARLAAGPEIYPWIPDQGDGSYRNPILFADYSDPDVIRVGDDYYLTASSFASTPGLPILRSRDLVNWTLVGHAIANLPDPRYAEVQPGAGVWAPALREHAGVFYLFVPLPDEGIYVVTAPQPEGPWGAPRLLIAGRGLIDPCPLWDDDGRAYLVHAYARSRAGIKDRLRVRPMAPDASRVLDEGRIVFQDPARHPTIEGPKLYKRDGWYYILAPAGGVPRGWQVALRARDIYGPYEDRVVLEQGRTNVNGPHQGALVDTPRGEWWFVHFQDAGVYGRIVHLEPVAWRDGWPMMGEAREPVARHEKPAGPAQPIAAPQTSDEFDVPGDQLAPQWQWQANHRDDWFTLRARPGYLRLSALALPPAGLAAAPNVLAQKLPARAFSVETEVQIAADAPAGLRAGIAIMGESHAALAVEAGATPGAPARVALFVDDRAVFAAPVSPGPVRLGIAFASGGACRFSYADAASGTHPIDHVFQARAGRWIGAKVGLFAVASGSDHGGFADFAYMRFSR
jgi:beta-xylosidase